VRAKTVNGEKPESKKHATPELRNLEHVLDGGKKFIHDFSRIGFRDSRSLNQASAVLCF
jgi:hypothetical protein